MPSAITSGERGANSTPGRTSRQRRLLRRRFPVVSFTMLPTAPVVDVSRRNGIAWDAVISCEMIGVYKPHPQAYAAAARWMALEPLRRY